MQTIEAGSGHGKTLLAPQTFADYRKPGQLNGRLYWHHTLRTIKARPTVFIVILAIFDYFVKNPLQAKKQAAKAAKEAERAKAREEESAYLAAKESGNSPPKPAHKSSDAAPTRKSSSAARKSSSAARKVSSIERNSDAAKEQPKPNPTAKKNALFDSSGDDDDDDDIFTSKKVSLM